MMFFQAPPALPLPELPGTHEALVVRQHDDNLGIMVPDHPPEVGGGVGQRMLGNDELITPEVTLVGVTKGEPLAF